MFKLIGAVCIMASSSLAGLSVSLRLKEQYAVNRQLCDMFALILIYLENEYLTSGEIMKRLSNESSADKLTFLKNADDTETAAENVKDFILLSPQQRARTAEYFRNFGRTDISGETAKTRLILKEFESQTKRLGEKCDKYCRLYAALGVLIGIGITVMLI